MKYVKIAVCVILLFVVNELSYSQTLQFCEKVSDNGTAVNPKTLFTIDKSKGYDKVFGKTSIQRRDR